MKIRYVGKTDVGRKRSHNEDNLHAVEEENLYMVADGMGGHASGEVASEMAVQTVAKFFKETSADDEITWPYKMEKGKEYENNRLTASMKLANLRIFETAAQNPGQRGMGTTLVVLLLTPDTAYFGNVGDSRIYRLRGDKLDQVTEDHSLLNDYIKMKDLTEEEIENFPHKNVIVRALGMKETVQVDVDAEPWEPGDTFMLCSDGLNGMIKDEVIREIMIEHRDNLEMCCDKLIEAANANGGNDNITVSVVQVAEA
ncbi:MAG: Stp1/IreP family PP2C-type Ser/Thr phosphatase [Persicimonas sp.]